MLATLHEEAIPEIRAYVLIADLQRWRRTDMAVEKLYEDSQNPLPRNTSVEPVSLTLRTFSFLHSLGDRVATAKLQELYALPHRYTEPRFHHIPSFYTTEGVLYDVPSPSSIDWIEEQRILKSLFYIRNRVLLGEQVDQPPAALPGSPCLWKFSIEYECYRLFETHLPEITQPSVPRTLCWQAPVAPLCDDIEWHDLFHDPRLTDISIGWSIFHTRCAWRFLAGRPCRKRTGSSSAI